MKSHQIGSMRELFAQYLFDLYDAETIYSGVLDRLAHATCNPELVATFRHQSQASAEHVLRLEQTIVEFGVMASQDNSEAVRGLAEEARDLLHVVCDAATRDAALIAAARRIFHEKMSRYSTLALLARHLGFRSAAARLDQSLEDETTEERRLAAIAHDVWLSSDPEVIPASNGAVPSPNGHLALHPAVCSS